MADTDLEDRRRPRIVKSPEADMPGSSAVNDDWQFFAFEASERVKALKTKIEEREKLLFDLQLADAMLDGNPDNGKHHREAGAMQDPDTFVCSCGDCELRRVKEMIVSVTFGLRKLKAIYAKML